jgi:hypothetical protein
MPKPLEAAMRLIEFAVETAPADPEPLLAYLLNRVPAVLRMRIGDYVNEIVDRRRVHRGEDVRLRPLNTFGYEDAEDLLGDIKQVLRAEQPLGQPSRDELRYARAFGPDERSFAPLYYPQPWSSGIDAFPMSPAEVREALGLTVGEVDALRDDILFLSTEAATGTVVNLVPQVKGRHQRTIRVAVAPYIDAISLPALLYAISDHPDVSMEFLPASFFHDQRDASYLGGAGNFDVGYCIEADRDNLKRASNVYTVFNEGITRSILLRQNTSEQTAYHAAPVLHVSMIGGLGPEKTFSVDTRFTEATLIEGFGEQLSIPADLIGSQKLQPVANWELALILAMASASVDRKQVAEPLIGLTISTDSHIWACHSGLIRPSVDAGSDIPPSLAGFEFEQLRLLRAGWQPGQREGSMEDRHAQLCWYVPKLKDGTKAAAIKNRWDGLVKDRMREPFEQLSVTGLINLKAGTIDHTRLREARKDKHELCRAMMAPLFAVFPAYRGAIWHVAPEAWTRKLFGPDDHLHYEPYWHFALKAAANQALAGRLELGS